MDGRTMRAGNDFASERVEPLGSREQAAFGELAMALRAASWDVAMGVVETGLERDLIPSYAALGTIKRLANLPALVVNSNQRVNSYQKKTQTDEQAQ